MGTEPDVKQPTQKHFESRLYNALKALDPVEDRPSSSSRAPRSGGWMSRDPSFGGSSKRPSSKCRSHCIEGKVDREGCGHSRIVAKARRNSGRLLDLRADGWEENCPKVERVD